MFTQRVNDFEEMVLELYGKPRTISYLCMDLIWKPISKKLRFVLVRDNEGCFILMCSDLSLAPADIIRAYSYRFKIEVNFKVLKHVMGVFFYRFWTTVWPRRAKEENEVDLTEITDDTEPRTVRLIKQAADANEGFVNMGLIATGILQIIAMSFPRTIWKEFRGWLRTCRSAIPSEEIVRSEIQVEYFHNFQVFSNSTTFKKLISKIRKRNYINMPMTA